MVDGAKNNCRLFDADEQRSRSDRSARTFGVSYDAISVVVHQQSIVHSMVEFRDGATIAQLSMPDMKLPIAYALEYPNRSTNSFGAIDWAELSRLDFEKPDRDTFRCLDLAYQAGRIGGTAPAWLSAANEIAVESFWPKARNGIRLPASLKQLCNTMMVKFQQRSRTY